MVVLSVSGLELVRGLGDQSFVVTLPEIRLQAGEVIAITGPSGSGKSTLIEGLGLLCSPRAVESFHLQGEDITSAVAAGRGVSDTYLAQLRTHQIGFVPQTGGLLPYLTVEENIRLQARILGRAADPTWIMGMLEQLGLLGLGKRYPQDLSVGQRQRVSFLRAMGHRPAILLADEPTAALDPDHARLLFDLMLATVQKIGIAMIVVTHEWDLVTEFDLRPLRAHHRGVGNVEFIA